MKDTDAAYMAGIIDGEGTISLGFRSPNAVSREVGQQITLQLIVAMTDEKTIRHLAEITGTENKVFNRKARQDHHKHLFAWQPTIAQAYEILKEVEPYMVTKQRNARIFMELVDIRRKSTRSERNWNRQYDLVIENQGLNKRGR